MDDFDKFSALLDATFAVTRSMAALRITEAYRSGKHWPATESYLWAADFLSRNKTLLSRSVRGAVRG